MLGKTERDSDGALVSLRGQIWIHCESVTLVTDICLPLKSFLHRLWATVNKGHWKKMQIPLRKVWGTVGDIEGQMGETLKELPSFWMLRCNNSIQEFSCGVTLCCC